MKPLSRSLLWFAWLWLGAVSLSAQTASLTAVEENGTRGKQVNMVFLSEGYTSSQMGTFAADVDATVAYLFDREPWNRYRSYINIYRIQIASNQSGTDNGSDKSQRDTYFHSGFNTPGITQLNYLTNAGNTRAFTLLNQLLPEYDIPIILVNDSQYGGSGGTFAVATTNFYSREVLEHELGHSFAKLTDEYDIEYQGYPSIEYPNGTTKTKRAEIRWNPWIDPSTPVPTPERSLEVFEPDYPYDEVAGLFEGGNYHIKGWYRPHDNALMRTLAQEPGVVTREAFVLNYYSKTTLINEFMPSSKTLTFNSRVPLSFGVNLKMPSTFPALQVTWKVDGIVRQGATGPSLNLLSETLGNGRHTVTAYVKDTTDWVRRDPTGLTDEEVTWTLTLTNQIGTAAINTPLPLSRVLPIGGTLTLDATANGAGPITYQWLKAGRPFTPNITTPVLTLPIQSLADAAVYTVKVTNAAASIPTSVNVAVVDPNARPVVIGKGRTATLTFLASTNLPPVSWSFVGPLTNGLRYAGATTKALQVKNADLADTGDYYWSAGDYTSPQPVSLLVVTGKPNYTGVSLSLPDAIVGGVYDAAFPLPLDELQTPNLFSAALPRGLKIDPKTGILSGIPTAPSKDTLQGDEITFMVGNEIGSVPVKTRLRVKPLPASAEGVFNGPVPRGSELGGDLGGRIDLAVLNSGSYSGKLILGAETFQIGGVLSVASASATTATGSFVIKPKAGPLAGIKVVFQVQDAGDGDAGTATVIGGKEGGGTSFTAWRNKWLPVVAGDPYVGYYTFGWKPFAADKTALQLPQGTSHGSFLIAADGKLTLTGKLADGESVTTAGHVGPGGEILIYQLLYNSLIKGSIQGVMHVDLGVVGDGSDTLLTSSTPPTWMRPENKVASNRLYRNGFGPFPLEVIGGRYLIPSSTTLVMGLSAASGVPLKNALLTFDALVGEDPMPVNADVDVEVKLAGVTKIATTPNTKSVSLTLVPTTGAFRGSYITLDNDPRVSPPTRPKVSRRVDFQGFLLNDEGTLRGRGYFLRDALPTDSPATTPTTSPRSSGEVRLDKAP